MVDNLAATRFLAVVGTSGSGKSSLVNCGLRPALHRGLMAKAGTAWRIAQFRPGANPLRAMSESLAQDGVLFTNFESEGLPLRDIVEATLQMSRLGLVDIYQQAPFDESINLLIVVDQFEELFRYRIVARALVPAAPRLASTVLVPTLGAPATASSDATAISFVNLLLEAAASNQRIYVVTSLCVPTFLGDCSRIPGLPEANNWGRQLSRD